MLSFTNGRFWVGWSERGEGGYSQRQRTSGRLLVLFAVLFHDKPGHGELRSAHLTAHIEWIARHPDVILVAGSLRGEPEDVPRGGLWVVEAPSKADVLALIESDPFSACGLRESVEVLHWSKAIPDRKTLV